MNVNNEIIYWYWIINWCYARLNWRIYLILISLSVEKLLDFYTDYLISSTSQTSAPGLSGLLDNSVSHDSITHFLSTNRFDSKSLRTSVKPLVREHENVNAYLVFDDWIIENNIPTKTRLFAGIGIMQKDAVPKDSTC